ncbi:hypothetical protein FRC03_011705 [Tulasnella sp. 419]|nr:hypothetical protein FRC02_005484 [Tulasnella sp. 418]KAG8966567.1 hypothetical protein FRC03_011705 [Tulasnella sp. 419]
MFVKSTIVAHVLVALSLLFQIVHSLPLNPRAVTVSSSGVVTVATSIGPAKGIKVGNGQVARFVVKYGTAARWANPVKAITWQNRDNDPSKMPLACPQPWISSNSYSEDCLYAVLYIPMSALNNMQSVPIYTWLHGGSLLFGSANDPEIDGSKLALSMNSIVAVVQYRLGALGWLPPSSAPGNDGNLGVKDVITALNFLRGSLPFLGGNINKIVVGGQSSGGHLVRALLAAPSASGLFAGGTIHSDPMTYGFLKKTVYQAVQNDFYSNHFGSCNNDFNCLLSQPLDTVVNTMTDYMNNQEGLLVDASVGIGEPLRPNLDGTLLTSSLTTTYPSGNKKPLLITTSKNDAGSSVFLIVPTSGGLPALYFPSYADGLFGTARGATISTSNFYPPGDPSLILDYAPDGDEGRQALERAITDNVFRCSSWDFSRRWTAQGGKVWVGEWDLGATHPANANNNYCTQPGRVCHQDEIYLIFGTTPNPTSDQSVLTSNYQARLKLFLNNPAAGPGGSPAQQVSGNDVRAVQMGGSQSGQQVPVGACDVAFWGASVPFDWQIFNE